MKVKWAVITLAGVFLLLFAVMPKAVTAEEPKSFIPDKALCAKMLRFGKEAYVRGRYLDAKEYFRKAVQADPGSPVAWRYYDQAVIFSLAEKVEKNAGLLLPDVSTRKEMRAGTSAAPPSAPTPAAPKKDTGFRIVDDEGC